MKLLQQIPLLLIAICLGMSQLVFSQNNTKAQIDSILKSGLNKKSYEEKKEAYGTISNLILKSNNSEDVFEYALSKDSTKLAKMLFLRKYGQKLSQQGTPDKALPIYLKGIKLAKELEDERALIDYHGIIGNAYQYLNKIDSALYHLNKGQTIAETPNNRDYLWYFYYQKGLLQGSLGNIEGKTKFYQKMGDLVLEKRVNTSINRFILYILIEHFSQIDAPNELALYTETLASYYEEANANLPSGHMPIQDIFNKMNNPENIPRLLNTMRVSDSTRSINSLVYATIALANTYNAMNQPNKAVSHLTYALKKLDSLSKPQVKMDILLVLANTLQYANRYQEAYEYKVQETTLRDSLNTQRMQRNIAELEVKFDTEKKERKILEQNLIIEKETRQKHQILGGLIALGILLLVGFLFFRKQLKDQKTIAVQKGAIQQQEIKELQQENKLLALNSMIEGQEAERLRIAKDLHDSLGGLLSTVKAHFGTIKKEIEQLEKLNITEKTNELIDEACIEVRRISHNMMPHALNISGLEGALEDMAESLNEEGYQTTLEMNGLTEKIQPTKEVMIYRLLQEVISNIRKHAEAKNILIQVLGHQKELNIIIEDDGKGFNYEKAMEQGGLGLKSINSRVQFLDGTIHWDSKPKQGTTITINIPKYD